ncbi:MAG: hypothetical protein GY772_30350 [bacterium]|nr:hypothetical protein [bacterium]
MTLEKGRGLGVVGLVEAGPVGGAAWAELDSEGAKAPGVPDAAAEAGAEAPGTEGGEGAVGGAADRVGSSTVADAATGALSQEAKASEASPMRASLTPAPKRGALDKGGRALSGEAKASTGHP